MLLHEVVDAFAEERQRLVDEVRDVQVETVEVIAFHRTRAIEAQHERLDEGGVLNADRDFDEDRVPRQSLHLQLLSRQMLRRRVHLDEGIAQSNGPQSCRTRGLLIGLRERQGTKLSRFGRLGIVDDADAAADGFVVVDKGVQQLDGLKGAEVRGLVPNRQSIVHATDPEAASRQLLTIQRYCCPRSLPADNASSRAGNWPFPARRSHLPHRCSADVTVAEWVEGV